MQKSGAKWLKVVQNYYVCLGGPACQRFGCAAAGRKDNHYVYDFLHQ